MKHRLPLVSIIIVNWNGREFLQTCLSSVYKQTYKHIEVIFVDNASSDTSIPFVKENFPHIKIKRNKKNVGFAEGNNIGYRLTKGDYVLLLNTDTQLQPDCIAQLVHAFQQNKQMATAQPKLRLMDTPSLTDTCASYLTYTGYLYHFGYRKNQRLKKYNQPRSVFSNKGACMMIRRSVIQKIGLFDDSFWCYYEETDFCHRVWLQNFECWYIPSAEAFHKDGGSQSKFNWRKIYFHNHKNKIRSMLKNFDTLSLVRFLIPYIIVSSVYEVFIIVFQKKWMVFFALPQAILWNVVNLSETMKLRQAIQSTRFISETQLLERILKNPHICYFFPWVGAARYNDE